MPTHTRTARSLLALALVASLVAAATPGAALGRQPVAAGVERAPASAPRPGPDAHDNATTAQPVRRLVDERAGAPTAPRRGPAAEAVAGVARGKPASTAAPPKSARTGET